MAGQGVVSIGLQIKHNEALDTMLKDFRSALTKMSNEAERTKWDGNVSKSFDSIRQKITEIESGYKKTFDELSNQKLSTENFKAYQEEVSSRFGTIANNIKELNEQLGNLGNKEYLKALNSQFDTLSNKVLGAYNQISSVMDIVKTFSGQDPKLAATYDDAISKIKQFRQEASAASAESAKITGISAEDYKKGFQGSKSQLIKDLQEYSKTFDDVVNKIKIKEKELSQVDNSNPHYKVLESELAVLRAEAQKYSEILLLLDNQLDKLGSSKGLSSKRFDLASEFTLGDSSKAVTDFVNNAQKYKAAYQEVTTLQLKNGKLRIPVHIDENGAKTLSSELEGIVSKLREHAKNNPIITSVKLMMDDGSVTGSKKKKKLTQQQDTALSSSIANAYSEGAKIAEETVKAGMAEIQKAFGEVPVKLKLDTEAFKTDLKAMIDESFRAIAKDTTGLNVNSELEKLVANLREVSTSLSGNESFKFGLDEASITRITTAIQNMADMIQRAFGVASNDDIAKQWTAIESKFKSVAGEEGKLLKSNKEHRVAIQELAIEYKKYLDMGGKNDLSTLTAHKQTVKNITAEYENLGKAAQEAAQKQEQTKKKSASTKVSSGEKDAINAVSRENKKLETQAGKTGTALDNEGKSAQTAAGKFRKLAKEKGAAVVANRELAKAAKETADALEREARARKETGTKTGKGAVNDITYADNFLKWQTEIKQSLMDSGNYAGVYDAKISQAANGTVKFTAVVRDLDGNLKKLSANVNGLGQISSPSISDMTAKQAVEFEKALMVAERIREVMAGINGEGAEPIRLSTSELEQYSYEVNQILKDLGKLSGTTYKVDITNSGKLLITKKEIAATGAEAKEFTIIIDRIDDVLETTANGVVVSSKKIQDALNGAFDSAKISTSTKDLVSKAQAAFNKFTLKHQGNSNWSLVADEVDRLKSSIAGINSQDGLNKFKQDLSDIAVRLNNIGKDNKIGSILGGNRTFSDINEVRANIDSLFASMGKVNEKSIKVAGTNKLTAEVKAANGEIRKMTVSLDSNGFARFVDNGIVQFSRLREAVSGIFKGIWGYFRYYLSPYMLVSYTRQVIDKVKEIDTAMTELRKVSDASPKDINAYFGEAVDSAKELGSSVKDMIAATADWSRMGYNLPDSRELGEVAVLYKNVGDGIDIDTANESLVSTIQGFQLQAKDAMSVIDSFNEVSNNYAISSAGIGEALKRSAAAFNAANTDLNQSIALITAGNEIVQSPEKIGTMWQTVSARIRGKICAHYTVMCRPPYEDNIKAA